MTIFSKILNREIPAEFVYEDDRVFAFNDANPQAPTHILIVPKEVIPRLVDASEDHKPLMGHMLYVAQVIAREKGIESGCRLVINNGADACQTVFHLHMHLMGGRGFSWPPG